MSLLSFSASLSWGSLIPTSHQIWDVFSHYVFHAPFILSLSLWDPQMCARLCIHRGRMRGVGCQRGLCVYRCVGSLDGVPQVPWAPSTFNLSLLLRLDNFPCQVSRFFCLLLTAFEYCEPFISVIVLFSSRTLFGSFMFSVSTDVPVLFMYHLPDFIHISLYFFEHLRRLFCSLW